MPPQQLIRFSFNRLLYLEMRFAYKKDNNPLKKNVNIGRIYIYIFDYSYILIMLIVEYIYNIYSTISMDFSNFHSVTPFLIIPVC